MLLFILILCVALFAALYITAFAVTGDAATTTLSQMLSENTTVQQLYLIFIGSYAFITFDVMFLVWIYDAISIVNETIAGSSWFAKHRLLFYDVTLYCFVVSSVAKLIGFIGLFWYDCNTHSQGHYAFAAVGFIFAVICMWLLFFRRLVIYYNLWSTHDEGKPPFKNWVLILDLLFLLLTTSLLIAFAATGNGILELLVGTCIVLDPFFLVWDFYRFPRHAELHFITTNLKSSHVYVIPEKDTYVTQLYKRFLWVYNNTRV